MLKFSVTQEISEVKTQAEDGAQLMGHWPRVLTLTVNLTTYSHLRERLPREDLPVSISMGDYLYCQ